MNINSSFPAETHPVEAGSETLEVARESALVRWMKKRRWFVAIVLVPTVLAAVYFGLIASDVYVSESRFVIKSPDEKHSQTSTLANLVQTTGLSGGQEQTNEVLTFIRSRDALRGLEQKPGIRDQYSARGADIFSRFPKPLADDSFESLFKYYTDMVDARFESEEGTAVVKVRAFTPQDAYSINARLLELSEGLVNRLNARAQMKGITEAQRQLQIATDRAKAARVTLTQYRNSQALIDPTQQATGVLDISNSMIAQRAALQAQLDLMVRVAPGNPSIPALRNRISAISVQISAQDSRVVGSGSGIASKMGGYENLLVEQEFATESMNAANAALVQARSDAQRQQFYLERVVDPNIPDRPLLPKRYLNILIVFAVAACLYFVAWMFMVGVIEHASED